MPSEIKREVTLEIVHVLFLDIVGYSKRLTDEQQALIDQLNQVVRNSAVFQTAEGADRLIKIPTGDGMALIFYNSPEQPVECALEISRGLKGFPELPVRMGVHSGPVSAVTDLNDRTNAAGIGINVAQRVMDCGDSGHILLSKRVAEDLQQYGRWRPYLHDLGEMEVKHGSQVHVFNLYTDGAGNPDLPEKLRQVKPTRRPDSTPAQARPAQKGEAARERMSICVLPFANMSGDAEQEYFSDGISEDIITDLSKVSALHVISRNTAFTFKGKPVDVRQVAGQLNVSHVLEGSVRKAAGRVRITAQLIDGSSDSHVWAERYDRDLNDIFALQDEISRAIVDALKVKLLPEEKKAIERRGTENVDAYNLYLMARQSYATGFEGDGRVNEAIIRLCRRAVEIDPNYAEAWALIAMAEMLLRSTFDRGGDGGLAAAERALELNADLAEAHAVKARILSEEKRHDEASREIEIALRLDPESQQVNKCAGVLRFRQQRLKESIRYFEKAVALEEGDFGSAGMLITCYTAIGNREAARRAAEITLARAEKVLAHDPNNGSAMGHGSDALAVLGKGERAKEWMGRALLIDPENLSMRYNFVCALANHLKDTEAALEMLGPAFEKMGTGLINHAKIDPDLDPLREHPRFKAMLAAAERRAELTG
ncbi:MAG: adenylate/guanylate cyclase domain-containing protein [Verrucomicrobia bacterium]|nr:MAG: adenylate/guanylate cyclase domain-containing protein [Verrucomicrobiota bacterium]